MSRQDMYYLDTETMSFTGPAILVQYAKVSDPEDITLYNPWLHPVHETIDLMEEIHDKGYIAYNNTFDAFQLAKLTTTSIEFGRRHGNVLPIDHVDEYAIAEEAARRGDCVKPRHILDLYLHALKGPYQSMMNRDPIRLKRIPTQAVETLISVLNDTIHFPDLYFSRKSDPKERWKAYPVMEEGIERTDLKDVVLSFAPSIAMKNLIKEIFGGETTAFTDIMVDKEYLPFEKEYAPYAMAHGKPGDWNDTWPVFVHHHIEHWERNEDARYYALKDIEYLAKLDEFFEYPDPDDDDSILAGMVAAVRWKGFKVDVPGIQKLINDAQDVVDSAPREFSKNAVCIEYLREVLSREEQEALRTADNKISTGKEVLLQLAKKTKGDTCDVCLGMAMLGADCDACEEGIVPSDEPHEAAVRAKELIKFRTALKEINLFNKCLASGDRIHTALKVIGTKSSRMSGTGGLSVHGIPHDKKVRKCFPLADPDSQLVGGDFVSYEVALLDAAFTDPELRADLLKKHTCRDCGGTGIVTVKDSAGFDTKETTTCYECGGEGKVRTKIHGLFGTFLFPGNTYEDILATKDLNGYKNLYSRAKSGVFALAYGGNAFTLVTKCGVDEEVAERAYENWVNKYQVWGEKRQAIVDMFCTAVQQDNGMFRWSKPADYIESMFGFRRYFTMENDTAKALFDLAESIPKVFFMFKGKVNRRDDRIQTVAGAIRSALYAACCGLQAANARAAANHLIQSAGAQKCKELQVRLWHLQPCGISEWLVQPLNIHDEIMMPTRPDLVTKAEEIVQDFVGELKNVVPLAGMEWEKLKSWAEK